MALKNIIIGITIIILTFSVVVYGIATFYERPSYNDFCPDVRIAKVIESQAECESIGGKWTSFEKECIEKPCPVKGSCDPDFSCRKDYQNALEKYSLILFLITLPLGILIIVLGGVVFGLEDVGAGLMGGGVFTILYGVGNYWRYSGDVLRFLLSLAGLVVVIWFAYWFNKRKK